MKLYEYYRSSCSYRLRIALNIKNIAAEAHSIDLLKGEQHAPEYKDINPQGTVPTLLDGDVMIYQSLAALEYLEETHPTPPIMPKSPVDRAEVRSIALAIVCGIQPMNNIGVLNYLQSEMNFSEDQKMQWYRHWIESGLAPIEQMLSDGKFCFGSTPTIADICLIPQIFNAIRFKCDVSFFSKIMSIYEECLKLDEFDRATPENNKPKPASVIDRIPPTDQ
jgi:maleylpyruvate isomerase